MSEKTQKSIVARHKKLAFFGVIGSDGTEKFLRMPKFTQLTPTASPYVIDPEIILSLSGKGENSETE